MTNVINPARVPNKDSQALTAMIIVNPHAHSGQQTAYSGADVRSILTAQIKDALHLDDLQWCETEGPGHGQKLAEQAVRSGCRYVFAGGGDGTINEVLNGLMGEIIREHLAEQQRPVLGVLPFGTSNDFFNALKSAEQSRAVDSADAVNAQANQTMNLDVGHVMFDNVERYFCLTVGIGLFSWANELYLDASRVFGRRFAHIPSAISAITSYRFLPNVEMSRNGRRSRARRILSVIVDNSPSIAGGTPLTPNARINDGQLDLCIIKPVSLLRLMWLVFQITRKAHTRSRAVELGQLRELVVTARQPLPIDVDGELVPELESKARRMEIKIMPAALQVVIPSLCELPPPAAAFDGNSEKDGRSA